MSLSESGRRSASNASSTSNTRRADLMVVPLISDCHHPDSLSGLANDIAFQRRKNTGRTTMKFTWFNLMPWPYLPDDFREKNRSVWVDIDSRLFDPVKSHEVYNNHLDLLEYAATLGFDGIGCNEHHQNAYGLMPSPNLIAATLARRTKDAAIVVLGNSIALYNPPIRVAEEFAMLGCISGGRLVAGFPVGTSMD